MNNPTSSTAQFNGTEAEREFIFSTQAIRERAGKIANLAKNGQTHFLIHEDKLQQVAEFVANVTRKNYPTLDIPFHSRWGHFDVGGIKRVSLLNEKLADARAIERLKAKIDLVVVSVLLDAGAGASWKYKEEASGKVFNRSEGLAVASLQMFMDGDFSDDKANPFRVDAARLCSLKASDLARGFQVSAEHNPLAGFDGRLQLLKSLGEAFRSDDDLFFDGKSYRPGNMIKSLIDESKGGLPATRLLRTLQRGLGRIWPGRVSISGQNMGDVWSYAPLGTGLAGLVPFHKLSQWLSYSLIEPCIEANINVTSADELTGLAEYRNGGLIVDRGLIELRDPSLAKIAHAPSSELIIEWRALTIVMLDRLGVAVRNLLGKSEAEFPLGKVLEGGTWWAGRLAASEKRASGEPPFTIISDGTVF